VPDRARTTATPDYRPAWRRSLAASTIGIVPLPLALVILAIVAIHVAGGIVPSDITMNIAVLGLGGFACAEIGHHIPGIRRIGAAAILATFVPSYLVYAGIIPPPLRQSITTFTDQSNFLYLFIAAVIVGSILGMDRRMLIGGFLKIFVPLMAGSLAAAVVGCAIGTVLGLGFTHSLFMIVVPIMAGGVGEGAIPLSIGYAGLSGQDQGVLLAQILPAVMFGSLTAILLAGGLSLLGRRYPSLTGDGRLQPGDDTPIADAPAPSDRTVDLPTIGAALILAMTLYLIGDLVQHLTGFPGPVTMLLLTVALKLGRLAPPALEHGAHRNYRFFAILVTYPLLFAIGVAKTPWQTLAEAFNPATIITIVATVVTMVTTGFLLARRVNLYPVDAAIVTACHSGQGGTGDVAILTAAGRLQLMPFAQVATRIGGAITVTIALACYMRFA
jgi:Na+/citrate or Na+/malate symporter